MASTTVENVELSLNRGNLYDLLRSVDKIRQSLEVTKDQLGTELLYLESIKPRILTELQILIDSSEARILDFRKQCETLIKRCQVSLADWTKNAEPLDRIACEVNSLSKLSAYVRFLKHISHLLNSIQLAVNESNWTKVSSLQTGLDDIAKDLWSSNCSHLKNYVTQLSSASVTSLVSFITDTLRAALSRAGVPFQHEHGSTKVNAVDKAKITELSLCLSRIQPISDQTVQTIAGEQRLDRFESKLNIVQIIMEPFRQRFLFHFCQDQKTNSIEKPEWFFTQLLSWTSSHLDFFETNLQPVLGDLMKLKSFNFCTEWMRAMVGLAVLRLEHDLPLLLGNFQMFTHLVDETLIFCIEMEHVGYPISEPNCLDILAANPEFLAFWMRVEYTCNAERVEALLSEESAWNWRCQTDDETDDNKVPECAEEFLVLIQVITDRYKLFRDNVAKLKFLALQLELLDDFRLRLVQLNRMLSSVWDDKYCQILNAVNYIILVLTDWNNQPFFVKLQSGRNTSACDPSTGNCAKPNPSHSRNSDSLPSAISPSNSGSNGAFDSVINLFVHMQKDMLHSLIVDVLVVELTSKLGSYRNEKWFAIKTAPTGVLHSFYAFILGLRNRLNYLLEHLDRSLFAKCLRVLCSQLNQYFYDNLLLKSQFCEAGAVQMRQDFEMGLYTVLASYCSHIKEGNLDLDNFFEDVNEGLVVLSLTVGNALLLREAIETTKLEKDLNLVEFGVNMEPSKVILLLKRRVDLIT